MKQTYIFRIVTQSVLNLFLVGLDWIPYLRVASSRINVPGSLKHGPRASRGLSNAADATGNNSHGGRNRGIGYTLTLNYKVINQINYLGTNNDTYFNLKEKSHSIVVSCHSKIVTVKIAR